MEVTSNDLPSAEFRSRPLDIETIQAGNVWLRLYSSQFPDPLGFGYRSSRFSDPRMGVADDERFAVVYLGSTLKVCFLEAVLRDQGNGRLGDWLIEYAELEAWTCAKVKVTEPLRLVDLRGDGHRSGWESLRTFHAARDTRKARPGRPLFGHMTCDLMGSSTHRGSTEKRTSRCMIERFRT